MEKQEYNDDDFLMISGIQHFAFCRRQWALIHIENAWEDNVLTMQGQKLHKNVDNISMSEKRKNIISVKAMPVKSRALGIYGRCDVVEFHRDDQGIPLSKYPGNYKVIPVEYKHGTTKNNDSDVLQLLAEAICLEEMLVTTIDYGYIYYAKNRRREKIEFTHELHVKLNKIVTEMHDYMAKNYTPKVKKSTKCESCSLRNLCFPSIFEREKASTYLNRRLWEQ